MKIFDFFRETISSTAPTTSTGDVFNADFPIGHFNAEEATKTIKNAMGVSVFYENFLLTSKNKMFFN